MRYVDKEKPPRQAPGGEESSIGWTSALQRIAALPILDFGGRYLQAHFLAEHAGDKSPHRVGLPAGGFREIRAGRPTGAPQQVQDLGGFAGLATVGRLLARLRRLRGRVGFLRPGGLFAGPALGRRDRARLCGHARLFRRVWLAGWSTWLGIGGVFWNNVHFDFSFRGDYRDAHINHSGSCRLQANSAGNLQQSGNRVKTVAHVRARSQVPAENAAGDRRTALPQKHRTGGQRGGNQRKHSAAMDEGSGVPGRTPERTPSSVLPIHRTTTGRRRRCDFDPVAYHDRLKHAGSNPPASHRDCPGAGCEGRYHQRSRRSSNEVGAERTLSRNHMAKLQAST